MTCAQERPDINWVFKAHPCDNWYGKINGQRLQDLIKNENRENIILANEKWNGLELINSLDGIVTCHGTIGIEAVSQGVPVLTPYKGWYGHAGFTLSANTKNEYVKFLKTNWWEDTPSKNAIHSKTN